jgi:leucyl-tRNA---protein transferase
VKLLRTIHGEIESCVYLPARLSQSEYRIVAELSDVEYEALMNAGWRKFGAALHRPVCEGCNECRSLRIDVEAFTPNRSQRRTLEKNADLTIAVGVPFLNEERLDLYNRYHQAQEVRRGWPELSKTAQDYYYSFVHNPIPALELVVRDKHQALKAVVLLDLTPKAISGVYHYHDPDESARGLGTFGMLQALSLARQLEKPWAYFGYWVKDCPSLSYKTNFQPCELLSDDGVWRPYNVGCA